MNLKSTARKILGVSLIPGALLGAQALTPTTYKVYFDGLPAGATATPASPAGGGIMALALRRRGSFAALQSVISFRIRQLAPDGSGQTVNTATFTKFGDDSSLIQTIKDLIAQKSTSLSITIPFLDSTQPQPPDPGDSGVDPLPAFVGPSITLTGLTCIESQTRSGDEDWDDLDDFQTEIIKVTFMSMAIAPEVPVPGPVPLGVNTGDPTAGAVLPSVPATPPVKNAGTGLTAQ